MELTIMDRFVLDAVLPKKGDGVTVGIVKAFRQSLPLTQEEMTETGFMTDDMVRNLLNSTSIAQDIKDVILKMIPSGKMIWDKTKDKGREFEISQPLLLIIKQEFDKMSDSKTLPEEFYDTYVKFRGGTA
jgi:hypothetical protein